ncbi:hypothetical protein [Actinoplanes sp. NPDC051851]|uniref:hypothetical protein n=1 Tax=Actinoplanes sp. NPDC051851 TaxID=3154753 RepID=UPI00341B3C6C
MTATQFRVTEVFDVPARAGLVVVGDTAPGQFVGVPALHDDVTGHPIGVLAVDHPTPRTRRTGETILLVNRGDAAFAVAGRLWTIDASPATG